MKTQKNQSHSPMPFFPEECIVIGNVNGKTLICNQPSQPLDRQVGEEALERNL